MIIRACQLIVSVEQLARDISQGTDTLPFNYRMYVYMYNFFFVVELRPESKPLFVISNRNGRWGGAPPPSASWYTTKILDIRY